MRWRRDGETTTRRINYLDEVMMDYSTQLSIIINIYMDAVVS